MSPQQLQRLVRTSFSFAWVGACMIALVVLSNQAVAIALNAQQQDEKKPQDEAKQDAEKKADEEKPADDEEKATAENAAKVRDVFEQLGGMLQDAVEEAAEAVFEEPFEDEHFNGGITLDENRELRRSFDLAKQQIEQGKITETVKALGELLTDTDTRDFFMAPSSRGRMRKSFRAAVQELLGSLPPEGRDAYELLFGTRARKLLEESVTERDWNKLNDVVRRYYHTEAGGQALYLLGSHYLDLDRPREALMCLERLREFQNSASFEPRLSALVATARYKAGDIQAAIADIETLRDANSEALELLAAGSNASAPSAAQLSSPESISQWLATAVGSPSRGDGALAADWLTFRGNASRSAPVSASLPLLSSQLQQQIATSYAIHSLESYRTAMNDAQLAVMPVLHPVVIGDNALVSTGSGLQVHNLSNGDTWSYPRTNGESSLDDHFWCGSAYGIPATNGQLAFVVEGQAQVSGGTDSNAGMQQQFLIGRRVRFGGGWPGPAFFDSSMQSVDGHLTNVLTAVELASKGKRRWQVGGPTGGDEPELAKAYFLGSPLSYGGRVYSIAEFQGSLRLLALDAETGKLEWNQELAIAESAISADTYRRMAGATPSIADGIIVCPTSCGGVVGLDLTTQSLAWAYRYPRRNETITNQNHYYRGGSPMTLNQGDRWVDATAVIAEGCVLITPLESDEVHCLDLRTGELKWKKPRGGKQQNLFVACIDDGKCVMVGRDRVIAWNLKDGKASWSEPLQLPEGIYPAGMGVQLKNRYLLPLSNAALAQIDLNSGEITDTQSTRRQLPLGNLVFANGQFVSLGPKFLETFPQRQPWHTSAEEALVANPESAAALTQKGEILQADGVMAEAIEHFRKAYELEPTPRRKNLLVAALLTGLRQELPESANYDELLKSLASEE